jgi:hypothetical protein
MGNITDPSGIHVEPDILLLGPELRDGSPTRDGPSRTRRDRLRRLAEPSLFVMGTGAILLAVHVAGDEGSPVATPAPSPRVSASVAPSPALAVPVTLPRLIAPQAAVPGERITVLGYRNGRLCGPAELRFDGAPVAHRLAAYVGPVNLDHMQVVLTMQVPRATMPGSHKIELYGPVPGGGSEAVCANVREHQAELATTAITVRPSADEH